MELKVTKEKVLEAAANCPEAKATLQTLFPDVFDNIAIRKYALPMSDAGLEDFSKRAFGDADALQVLSVASVNPKYYRRGLYLTENYRVEVMPSNNNGTQIIFFKR